VFLVTITEFSALTVTRSHKLNDRDHAGLADGSAAPEEHLPRFFAKAGHADADPKKTKKNGGGKGNWSVSITFLNAANKIIHADVASPTGVSMARKFKTPSST
jgi:hypothetical protein